MKSRCMSVGACLAVVTLARPLSAHVLDEYLQATRIEIAADIVRLEVDLTPGASIATNVFFGINTDRDGQISRTEARAYAERVLTELDLAVDDRRLTLSLDDSSFPSFEEMSAGTGTIRLKASAPLRSRAGRHRLWYRNRHDRERAVYLVNALVPSSSGVSLGTPQRDSLQREFALDYTTTATAAAAGRPSTEDLGRLLIVAGVIAFVVYRFRQSRLVTG